MGYFAQNLKFLRVYQKLSQDALARELGLNRGNIASYEKGSAEPSLKNLLKISQYFKINLNSLLDTSVEEHQQLIESLSVHSQINENAGIDVSDEIESTFREKLKLNKQGLEEFRKHSDEMSMILEGFKQFHKFKMETNEPISDDVKKMAHDYEKLLEVLEEVLKTNKNIIHMLEETE